ncbi:competence protein ComJ [Kovacikia minuta CCNUW1]|uniref:competence protein ComJ n=1 Tax=Kovacikia minuta TaxID=2931930 RepID=UPI001CCCAEC2|nr:competence protein ComJ [Kovacikia minuta CCNUW1]
MNCLESFDFCPFYAQIIVWNSDSSIKFDEQWTDQHEKQGFLWHSGYVAFQTVSDGTDYVVEVWLAECIDFQPNAIRSIQVPFSIGPPEIVVITDLFGSTEKEVIETLVARLRSNLPVAFAGRGALSDTRGYPPVLTSSASLH